MISGDRATPTPAVRFRGRSKTPFHLKHFLGLSDNVTYFAEQLSPGDVSTYHHRITFKPQVIVPDFDFRGKIEALIENEPEAMQ